MSSDSSLGGVCVKQWLSLLAQELQRGCSIEGSVVDASSLSAPALWEYDMFVVASEAIQEMNADLLSCLVEISFHRASIVFSLQNLCYRCFTGIWPLGVQDAVLVDRSLKSSACDLLLSRAPTDLDHTPEALRVLLCLLDCAKENTLQGKALARGSIEASLESFTKVQMRRALALRTVLCRSHDYRIEHTTLSEVGLNLSIGWTENSIMSSRVMLFSLMGEIINYCNGTGSMSKGVVSIQSLG